jgi:hypothetical protein
MADIQALPFFTNTFHTSSSLNLLDKIPFPLIHLKEINRVCMNQRAQLLFSDPFSWSIETADEKNWLGGKSSGRFSGQGFENVQLLLKGQGGEMEPAWRIEKTGSLWWKIRNHANHFELIRTQFLKAAR